MTQVKNVRSALIPIRAMALAVAISGCSNAPEEGVEDRTLPDYQIWDSAGTVIVENHKDTADLPVWRLAAGPTVRIGQVDGDPAQAFGNIVAAALLSDGTIAVADNQALEVRLFAADGGHLRSVGRRGSGPGEYQQIYSLTRLADDSLLVVDTFLNRATILTRTGDVGRTVPLRPPLGQGPSGSAAPNSVRLVHPTIGGTWIGVLEALSILPAGMVPPVLVDLPGAVYSFGDDGVLQDTVLRTAGIGTLFTPANRPGGQALSSYRVMRPFAGLRTHVVLRREQIFIAESTRFEIRIHAPDGSLLRKIRYPGLERPYTDQEYEATRRQALATAQDDERRQAVEAMLDWTHKPTMRPALSGLDLDEAGHLWVREWGGESGHPVRWLVLDPGGIAVAVAELPRGLAVRELGHEHVVAVSRGAFDVQYLEVWSWVR